MIEQEQGLPALWVRLILAVDVDPMVGRLNFTQWCWMSLMSKAPCRDLWAHVGRQWSLHPLSPSYTPLPQASRPRVSRPKLLTSQLWCCGWPILPGALSSWASTVWVWLHPGLLFLSVGWTPRLLGSLCLDQTVFLNLLVSGASAGAAGERKPAPTPTPTTGFPWGWVPLPSQWRHETGHHEVSVGGHKAWPLTAWASKLVGEASWCPWATGWHGSRKESDWRKSEGTLLQNSMDPSPSSPSSW